MEQKKIALKLMLILLFLVVFFHLSVIFEMVSYKIVWAGKINSLEEMRVLESISILINMLLIVVLSIKYKNINNNTSSRAIDIIIWIFVFVFALNTFGNLFATSWIEFILGTVLTGISSILCWVIVRKRKSI